MFLCVFGGGGGEKILILYIIASPLKMGQSFCMFKGPLEAHVKEPR